MQTLGRGVLNIHQEVGLPTSPPGTASISSSSTPSALELAMSASSECAASAGMSASAASVAPLAASSLSIRHISASEIWARPPLHDRIRFGSAVGNLTK